MKLIRNSTTLSILVAFALLASSCSISADQDVPDLERRAYDLNKGIMCPVCPGESIDQSQNPLAIQMRGVVSEKLSEGWSEQDIKDFFVERYGPSVLLEPPTEGFSIAAWIVPPTAFVLALGALLLALRWMRTTSETRAEAEAAVVDGTQAYYLERIEAALAEQPMTSEKQEPEKRVSEGSGSWL